MDNTTPIQELIKLLEYKKQNGIRFTSDILNDVKRLLPKEKEFVGEVFEAGERNARTENGVYYAAPNKEQFLYQLYPGK